MLGYASRTGTRRNLAALRAAGWRLMLSARGPLRPEGFRYALDNGAWTSFQRGEPFHTAAFEQALARVGAEADWIVLPDIVMGGVPSLRFSRTWLEKLRQRRTLRDKTFLFAVQNGMRPHRVMRLSLDADGRRVTHATPLDASNPAFGLPTYGAVDGDGLYFVANSQKNAYDAYGAPKDAAKLQAVRVFRSNLRFAWDRAAGLPAVPRPAALGTSKPGSGRFANVEGGSESVTGN